MRDDSNIYMVDLGTGMGRELLPLSIGYITSYAMNNKVLKEAFKFIIHYLNRDYERFVHTWRNPIVVAIAFYGWNALASLKLAKYVKQCHPEARIVLGGPSVPLHPERIHAFMTNNQFVDILVHGEGEVTFAELLLNVNGHLSEVQGITYRDHSAKLGYVTNPKRDLIDDLNTIPSPYLNGIFDELYKTHKEQITGTLFETNRGCPFNCSFCSWGNSSKGIIRKYSVERVFQEIEWMRHNKIFYAYGADANFGIFYERDLSIADKFAESHERYGYPGYLRICWSKNNSEKILTIFDRLRNGGVDTLMTLSMQSYNRKTLRAIRRNNIRHGDLIRLRNELHKRAIQTYTELILGLPEETYSSFREGISNVMTGQLDDLISIYPCSMIENAELSTPESRAKYNIETRVCYAASLRTATTAGSAREIDEIVVATSSMTTKDWQHCFVYGHMVWALYFYRVAFYVFNYLHYSHEVSVSTLAEYIISESENNTIQYPIIANAISHLVNQSESILNNGSMTLPVVGYGDRYFQPNEAVVTLLLDNTEAFYLELKTIISKYSTMHGIIVCDDVLSEIIKYQQIRIPHFPQPRRRKYAFTYNIPEYYDAISRGEPVPHILRKQSAIILQLHDRIISEKQAFALDRIDKGITLKLYGIDVLGKSRVSGELDGKRGVPNDTRRDLR